MVEAWYYATSSEPGQAPHRYSPNRPVALSQIAKLGVRVARIDLANYQSHIANLVASTPYAHMDEITISRSTLPNYDALLAMFYAEHIHPDEEVRYVVEGSGYFDLRTPNDLWIRLQAGPGDLIILPPGLYHRFTLDSRDYIKCVRLFRETTAWTSINRSDAADSHPDRLAYLKSFGDAGRHFKALPSSSSTAAGAPAAACCC
ncbi:1,2-dihydroxy-3-keto-5-methylthiopentene dioxygenase [Phlyctochytrium arcticum]|nr:1,2-dihydroxy-3-keto-5-methylthiopentene dioxygenase [Phlyctochytrium arcticum]